MIKILEQKLNGKRNRLSMIQHGNKVVPQRKISNWKSNAPATIDNDICTPSLSLFQVLTNQINEVRLQKVAANISSEKVHAFVRAEIGITINAVIPSLYQYNPPCYHFLMTNCMIFPACFFWFLLATLPVCLQLHGQFDHRQKQMASSMQVANKSNAVRLKVGVYAIIF